MPLPTLSSLTSRGLGGTSSSSGGRRTGRSPILSRGEEEEKEGKERKGKEKDATRRQKNRRQSGSKHQSLFVFLREQTLPPSLDKRERESSHARLPNAPVREREPPRRIIRDDDDRRSQRRRRRLRPHDLLLGDAIDPRDALRGHRAPARAPIRRRPPHARGQRHKEARGGRAARGGRVGREGGRHELVRR